MEKKTRKRGTILGRVKNGWIYTSNPQNAIMTNDDNFIFIYIKLRQIKPCLIKFHQVQVYRQTEAVGEARTLRASYLRRPKV